MNDIPNVIRVFYLHFNVPQLRFQTINNNNKMFACFVILQIIIIVQMSRQCKQIMSKILRLHFHYLFVFQVTSELGLCAPQSTFFI